MPVHAWQISLALACAGLAGLAHHYIVTGGRWWDWDQFWHHESLIAMCAAAATGLMVGSWVGK